LQKVRIFADFCFPCTTYLIILGDMR